ncbi:universal stress protein [Ruania zhangjianzhongii]|uniref:universal stress protein n=1 Tax=Ruania zhangjianzhongii TaxID=2603206 RepID=UPI0011C8C9A8|nr:universal stress protein [Ruania zhangjianzhongii]
MGLTVGFDDTEQGRDALELGVLLSQAFGRTLTVATVFPREDNGVLHGAADSQWRAAERAKADAVLAVARDRVGDRVPIETIALGPGSAARLLYQYAEDEQPSALVLGSSAQASFGLVSPGSTVERLLHGISCPVVVAPKGYTADPGLAGPIAVAYDGSEEAENAVEFAARLAAEAGAAIRVVAVAEGAMRSGLEEQVPAVAASLDVPATGEILPVRRSVAAVLSDLPGERPSALVCGSRGYGPVRQVFLGSVSVRVVRAAAYPVVVVPRP